MIYFFKKKFFFLFTVSDSECKKIFKKEESVKIFEKSWFTLLISQEFEIYREHRRNYFIEEIQQNKLMSNDSKFYWTIFYFNFCD